MGVELGQERDFSATSTQEASSNSLRPPPTTPEMWAGPNNPLLTDDTEMRQCKLGESPWVATVSRPDICACLARMASTVNKLCGSDAYRIYEVVRVAGGWQQVTGLRYALPSHPRETHGGGGGVKDDRRNGGEKAHSGSMSLVGWSAAAFWGASRRKESADWAL